MQYYPFDSRNTLYKNKLGALGEGETLRLRLLIHNDAHLHDAYLKLRNDETEEISELRLTPAEFLGDYRFYDGEITLNEGLYWYQFRYTSDYGDFCVVKQGETLGIVAREGDWWQLTVYSKDYTTPNWLDGGIIYQIFPDRFYNSGTAKENIPEDRFICDNWDKQPEHRQINDKCSLGNDYYGGDLKGIEEKLPYLEGLGVSCIYLNPIFEAHSNHRYNTADYLKVDSSLGTEQDLVSLIRAAKKRSIYIVLDGVFSHTGDDSIYFNSKNRYNNIGAVNGEHSPYRSWFKFGDYEKTGYSCWWGVPSLPETDEDDLSFSNFITGEKGVIRYWLKKGIKGWRLDVADELPDSFLDKIRLAVKAESPENYLLGEVWEDASNKISYGNRRRFLRGKQLDSVMNYPFAEAIITFVKGGKAKDLKDTVLSVLENYPPQSVKLLMNHIGTHDTMRALTRLGTDNEYVGDRSWQAVQSLTIEQYNHGIKLLKLAAVLQYTLPGVPSLYYGDEAGMQGYGDPFCRGTYPWGKENSELLNFYKALGNFRRENKAFASGEFIPISSNGGCIAYIRKSDTNSVLVAVNTETNPVTIDIPSKFSTAEVFSGNKPKNGKITVESESFIILKK